MIRLLHGDCRDILPTLADNSVHCVVTSPPYFGLRDYGTGTWEGGDAACGHKAPSRFDYPLNAGIGKPGFEQTQRSNAGSSTSQFRDICGRCGARRIDRQIGLEATPDEYLATMVAVFREARRVLRPDGVCWVNMGDSYAANGGAVSFGSSDEFVGRADTAVQRRKAPGGFKPKDLMMMPARLAIALQADGWFLRSMLPWCLSGGTRVYVRCQKGEMPMTIKDMVRLDPTTLQLWNGERWTQVLGWRENERPDVTYEIELRSGQRIGCTGDHLWPTQRGNVRTDQLRVSGSLFPADVIETCQLPEPPVVRRPSALDDEMVGWFVGLYIAEGCRYEREINIASHTKEEARFAKLREIADAFHAAMTLTKRTENSANVSLHGPILHGIIDAYVSGRIASDKHLSVRCWERSNTFLRAVLDGYLSGDGHWDERNKRWRLGFCNNDELVADLRTICARLGVTIRLRRVVHKLNGDEFPGYRGEIRFDRAPQLEGLGHFKARDDGEVVAIRESRARKFWDIAVADEPHLFALASGVLTHNCKRSAMPESVTDRPASAVEYVFLLTKSSRYFYDAEAVKRGAAEGSAARYASPFMGQKEMSGEGRPDGATNTHGMKPFTGSRNMRNSDLFYDSLEDAPEPAPRMRRVKIPGGWDTGAGAHGTIHRGGRTSAEYQEQLVPDVPRGPSPEPLGLICDPSTGEPLALDVNPAAFSAAHFATFPPKLVEPLVRAGTSERGCCAACGAPWVRQVEETPEYAAEKARMRASLGPDFHMKRAGIDAVKGVGTGGNPATLPPKNTTTGWAASCACNAPAVPCTVLDPFAGAGTTLLVADRLQRDAIGIELSDAYGSMASERVAQDAPLFAGVPEESPGRAGEPLKAVTSPRQDGHPWNENNGRGFFPSGSRPAPVVDDAPLLAWLEAAQ